MFARARKSPYGLYHMAGNAYEWVQDWYGTPHDSLSRQESTRTKPGPVQGPAWRLWSDLPKYLLTYGRFRLSPETKEQLHGFRCAGGEDAENGGVSPRPRRAVTRLFPSLVLGCLFLCDLRNAVRRSR